MAKKKLPTPRARVNYLEDAEIKIDFVGTAIGDALKALAKCQPDGVKKELAELTGMKKRMAEIEAQLIKKREKIQREHGVVSRWAELEQMG